MLSTMINYGRGVSSKGSVYIYMLWLNKWMNVHHRHHHHHIHRSVGSSLSAEPRAKPVLFESNLASTGETRSVWAKCDLFESNPVWLGQTRSAQAKLSLYGLNYIVPVPTKKQHMMTVQSGSTIANGRKITLSELLWPSSVKRIVQLQNRKKNHVNHMYCTCVHTIMRICMHVCACMSA